MKWLPVQADIELEVDARTQTVTEDNLATVTGNTYRIEQSDGTYIYYAFFVYNSTDEVVYNVYAIDLSVAVAEGVLGSYQDTFDRSFQVDTTAPYFLSVEQKSMKAEEIETTLVGRRMPHPSAVTLSIRIGARCSSSRRMRPPTIFSFTMFGTMPESDIPSPITRW